MYQILSVTQILIRIPNRKIHQKGFVSSKLDEAIWFYDDLMMIIDISKEINDLEWNTTCELHLKIIDGNFFSSVLGGFVDRNRLHADTAFKCASQSTF